MTAFPAMRGGWIDPSPPEPPETQTPATFAARLYRALGPLAQRDEETGWSLLTLVSALGLMFQIVEDVVRDTADGPGWSILLDLDRCPEIALPWLGQFVGVRIPSGLDEAAQRAWVASTDGFRRGTRDALIGAARATLTGAQVVIFRERDHDPLDTPDYAYFLTVRTYQSQTPDPAATLRALLAQKPAGIVLDYAAAVGQDYAQLQAGHVSYDAVLAAYPDYVAVQTDEPT